MRTEMTLMLHDEDREQLARLGGELNLTAREMAERILRRALSKTPGRSARSNSERAADRALRQVELAKLLRRRRLSTLGQADKRRLAERFGVTERTIYRDLVVVERVLKHASDDARPTTIGPSDGPRIAAAT